MHPRVRRILGPLVLLLLAGLSPLLAQGPAPAQSPDVERLAHLVKLWGAIHYLHPYLAYKEIDWDAALVKAVPAVRSAKTSQEYAAAVQGMLDALGDPVTRVDSKKEAAGPEAPKAEGKPAPLLRWLDDRTLVVDLRSRVGYSGWMSMIPEVREVVKAVARAETLILDLRLPQPAGSEEEEGFEFSLGPVQPLLARRAVRAPAQRYRLFSGYPPQDGSSSGGYWSGFVNLSAQTFGPAAMGGPGRVAFLMTPHTPLPPIALALQAGGDGVLVSEGDLGEEAVISRQDIDLGEGLEARVRVSEILPVAGWPGVHADARIAPGASDEEAVKASLAALGSKRPALAAAFAPLPDAVARPDNAYREMLDPSLEHRILAVARAWSVIHYFYPYRHLIGDWDAVLPASIARMEEVHDARGYATAVAEMMAHVADGHTNVYGHPESLRIYGEAGVPVLPLWVEGKWVVVALGESAQTSGLQVGDVITGVDGAPPEERVERLRPVLAAANEGGFRQKVRNYLLAGPEGSTLSLTVAGRDGAIREVKLPREKGASRRVSPAPTGETVRVLPGNLGYVDLTRLTVAEIDPMLDKLKETGGIIFDMRGYPKGVFATLGARMNSRGARFAAQFRRSEVSAFSPEEGDSGYYFSQPIPQTDKWKYSGRTVMLIDEQAISQSEHTGLFLEAASGTKFVGSPTAGSNGDVTSFLLPGGITVSFTGHDVRHADGRQLQRIGLVPDVPVAPTIQGIREGKDEVLDRAVRYLNEELSAPAAAESPAAPGGGSGSEGGNASR